LIFKTIRSDSEVDDAHLNTDFRQVMRVSQFGRYQELEIVAVRNPVITKTNDHLATLFDNVLGQKRFKGGVKLLFNVLEEHWHAHTDAVFDDLKELRVGKLDHLNVVFLLH